MKASLRSREKPSERSRWRRYVIVIAEEVANGWSAWFRDTPHNVCIGDTDLLAILTLIEAHGSIDMDAWDMIKLESRSNPAHSEFLLPANVA